VFPLFVVGNWKMHKGASETTEFCADLRRRTENLDARSVHVAVCPPYTSLREAVASGLDTFAQNVHWEREGAFTGEVSAPMLKELGVTGVIVGHSERRQYFGETDDSGARRALAALRGGLDVIVCVGETEAEREAGVTERVLRRQVTAISDVIGDHEDALVIAYEPVWAIGTGKTATPELAQQAHAFIRSLYDVTHVLYGGSCKPENVEPMFAQPDVDGALVGGASLDVDSFTAICQAAARSRS
jgi:triosephosphate isomerase (TIM)